MPVARELDPAYITIDTGYQAQYQHSKAPSSPSQYDLLTLSISSIASAAKRSCRLHLLTILNLFMAALVVWYSIVAKIPRYTQVYSFGLYLRGARPYLHYLG